MDINKMFAFTMECGARGLIIADDIKEAIQKLEEQQKVKITTTEFSEFQYKKQESLNDLWIWKLDDTYRLGDVVITEEW